MTNIIKGINSLAYQGVNAANPPDIIVLKRAPTSTDSKNVVLGDLWLDRSTATLYQLVSLANDTAVWNTIISDNPTAGTDIESAGRVTIKSSLGSANAIDIEVTDNAGGVAITAKNGGIGLVATGSGSVSIDADNAGDAAVGVFALNGGMSIATAVGEGLTLTNTVESAQIIVGSGDPNTNPTTALKGSLFIRTDGAAATTLYVNTDGMNAWTALT